MRLDRFKYLFALLAQRTYPIFGEVFECSSGSYAVIGIAYGWVIDITTYFAFVLFHSQIIIRE